MSLPGRKLRAWWKLLPCWPLIAFLLFSRVHAQTSAPSSPEIQALLSSRNWNEIVRILAPLPERTADQDFDLGTALAHLERWSEAETAFESGSQLSPHDERFPVELAGIAFKQKHYPRAAHLLRHAIQLSPSDSYAKDFLGTVYFIEGNLPAALKYWNRINKPQITAVHTDPVPQVSAALLDRAFAFSPASVLTLSQFLNSDARVRGLGIFAEHQFDLRARDDGAFDIDFRNQELNGFGNTRLEALLTFFRGLPFQSVTPEFDNFHHQAINFTSLLRWDAQKRRASAELSGPFERSAKYRYIFTLDLRNENWALRNGFTGPAPTLASLNLRRELGSIDIASHASDRLRWSAGAETSHRDYRSVVPGSLLTSNLLATGYQLKQVTQLEATLVRVPEHRFTINAGATSQAARLWSAPQESFEKLQGSIAAHWSPQATGDDLEMQERIRVGKTFGQVPFDELFMLGLERDNDLPMRAHIGTRDGRKGSAPLGRNYLLGAWEQDKNLYGNGLIAVKLGPFVDIGAINDPGGAFGSHKWLFDTGAQLKFRVFSTTIAFSYGKDLRSGNNAFYLRLVQ